MKNFIAKLIKQLIWPICVTLTLLIFNIVYIVDKSIALYQHHIVVPFLEQLAALIIFPISISFLYLNMQYSKIMLLTYKESVPYLKALTLQYFQSDDFKNLKTHNIKFIDILNPWLLTIENSILVKILSKFLSNVPFFKIYTDIAYIEVMQYDEAEREKQIIEILYKRITEYAEDKLSTNKSSILIAVLILINVLFSTLI